MTIMRFAVLEWFPNAVSTNLFGAICGFRLDGLKMYIFFDNYTVFLKLRNILFFVENRKKSRNISAHWIPHIGTRRDDIQKENNLDEF